MRRFPKGKCNLCGSDGPFYVHCSSWCQACRVARSSKRYWGSKTVRAKAREQHFFRKYGITLPDLQALLLAQNSKCAICRTDIVGKTKPNVDHSHKTGRIRGLLCSCCNTALGLFKEDQSAMRRAIAYLRRDGDTDA